MAISTYAELKSAVQYWTGRGDSKVISRIPDFIRLGEERIFYSGERLLRVSDMITVLSPFTIAAGTNYAALPADWLQFARVRSDAQPLIEYMSPDALEDLPSPGSETAYTIEGRRFIYGQTPSVSLNLTARYYARPAYLTADADTNWLLTKAPSVYLYAALLEFALFVKDSNRAGEWGTLLDKAITGLESGDAAAMVAGGRLRQRRA